MNFTKTYPNLAQSWGISGIVIACMLVFSPLNMVLIAPLGKEYAMLVYYAVTMAVAFAAGHFIRKNELNTTQYPYGINQAHLLPIIMLGAIGLLFGVVSPIGNLIPMPELFQQMFKELADMKGFGAFMMMVVAAPVFEEYIFRGIILDGLLKKYTPAKAIFWSSFLFGFVHLNPWQFVTGLVIGAFIGWIYLRTRSLSISIIIHATVNGCAFILQQFVDEETMFEQSYAESMGGLNNAIVITAGAISIAVACILILNKRLTSSPFKQLTDDESHQL